ncbi:MAG: hypothetical protein HN867_08905 [Deltaproteobacteria bacterium]|jgi:hypothetical protein|nr:hypothetical protein [Deltaproteobacteria bacterium]
MKIPKKSQLFCGLSLLLLILASCGGGDSSSESGTKATKPNIVTVQPRSGLKGFASSTGALPTLIPSAVDGKGKKLLAVYMVGSDLEGNNGAGTIDFKEMVAATSAELDNLEVIVAFGGASNWKGMWFANLDQIRNDSLDGVFSNESESEYLYVAPQAHMGDASSLKLFLSFLDSYTNFDQRMLVFWDHGANLEGFGNDENFNNDPLQLKEIEDSLATATQTYDVIGFDSCLMATLEVAKVVRGKADFLLASEELEPGHGWNWKHALEAYAVADNATAAAKSIIDNFVAKGSHPYEDSGKTLSLVDLSKYEDVVNQLDLVLENLTEQLQVSDQTVISALNNSTSKTQAYGKSAQSGTRSSVDLKHMSHLTKQRVTEDDQKSSLESLIAAIDNYVVYSKEDGTRPNSWGVAIDAPENAVKPIGALTDYYNSLRVSENWVNFAQVYSTAKASDTTAPTVANYVTETNAANVSFDLENWDEEWDTSWTEEEGAASEGESTAQGDSSILCEDGLSTERSNRAARYLPFLIGDRRNTVKVKTNRNARSCVSGATVGALATFKDPNLSLVRTIYGISEEYEEGTYFSVIAELNAYPTQVEGQYFTPEWDQRWYTIKVNADESIFMPLYFEDQYQENGQTYSVYVGEIDYYDSGKDYEALGYDFPADYALLRLVVNENSEVTQYGIQTYKLQFRDEDDEEGYILIDKTTETLKPNDKLQFFTYAFNLNDLETGEEWFEISEVVEVTQKPEFTLELLELADEFGEPVTFQYVMYGEDASGNSVLTELSPVAGLTDSTSDSDSDSSQSAEEGPNSELAGSTGNEITQPIVLDCSSLSQEIGTEAVNLLNQYNYQKCSLVGGVLVANSNDSFPAGLDITALTQRQADLLAEILDNNQDGYLDDTGVVNLLQTRSTGTWMNMMSSSNEALEGEIISALGEYLGKDMGVKHSWLSAASGDAGVNGVEEVLLEEAIHLWHHYGYTSAYPDQFSASSTGCGEETSAGCNWNQSTLTRLTWEAMAGEYPWYRHPENTEAVNGVITGTCIDPSCASIEFLMNLLVEYRGIKDHASGNDEFPSTPEAVKTKLSETAIGQEMLTILEDSVYNQLLNGLTRNY